jgi:PAS domain S-box-containing protein
MKNLNNDMADIFIINNDGNIISSCRAINIKGYDILGKHISILYPQESIDKGEPVENLRLTKENRYYEIEGFRLKYDNSQFLAKEIYTAIYDDDGKIFRYFILVSRDITEKKKAEDNLLKSEKLLKSLLEATPDPIIITLDSKIIMTNKKTEILFGYSREEIIGGYGTMLIPNRFKEEVINVKSKLDINMGVRLELLGKHKDGTEFPIEISMSPLITDDGIVISTSIRDISERVKIERDLIEARRILEQSLGAKELFLAQMSHEIRTPMNAIVGFTNLISKTNLSKDQRQYINAIKTSGENLLVIINDILDISKLRSKKVIFEQIPFSLSKIIKSLGDLMMPRITEKNIRFLSDIDKNIPDNIIGDSSRLTQILINLVGNSIKFTNSGYVLLTIDLLEEYKDDVDIKFSIIDTGIGIPPDKIEKIFQNYTQESVETSRVYGGTGLGLTIVKQLVELQGGEIWVTSKMDMGSTFNFRLKFKKAISVIIDKGDNNIHISETKNEVIEDIERPGFDGLKVLLVEDNVLNQILAEKILSNWGCKVIIADNGKIAIKKLTENDFDIIFMDIQLPEMDGYETTNYIRENMNSHISKIPIIAMTANAMYGESDKAIKAGMDDYISKPYEEEKLYDKINFFINLTCKI